MTHVYDIDEPGLKFVRAAGEIGDEIRDAATDVDRQAAFPQAALKLLANRGFFGLCISEKFGGRGQGPGVFAGVVEALAAACPSTAMIYVMHVSAAQVLAASQTLAGRDELLADVARGSHLSTLAFSERGSRSQFWAPVSELREAGDGGCVVSAAKSWVTAAHHADSYVSSARKPGAASPLESTLFLVCRQAAGVTVAGRFDGLGLRGNDSAPVEFSNVTVRAGDLLSRQGEGANLMLEVALPWFAVGTAAMAHGLCLAALGATLKHLTEAGFESDGTKLRDLPNLRARAAEMSCRTEQSRALLGHTTRLMRSPDERTPLFVLQSRLAALEAALQVTDLAMKACGGTAFSRRLGVEQMFRDARAGWVMAPTADHLQDFVGRALTGLPLF